MIANLRPVLAGALLIACGYSAVAHSLPSPNATASLRDEEAEIERLVKQIQSTREPGNARLFKQLTGIRSMASFEAMARHCKSVIRSDVMVKAFESFENYVGVEEVEETAIEWIAEQTDTGGPWYSQAAIQGLVLFGDPAKESLTTIVKKSKDPIVRAWAIGPLMADLRDDGGADGLKTILENAEAGYSAKREDLLEILRGFEGSDNNEAFFKGLKSKKVPALNKALIIEAVGDRQVDGADKALLAALKDKAPAVQIAAMLALDKRGEGAHAAAVKKLIKSKDEGVRRQAVISLTEIRAGDEDWVEELVSLGKSKDPATRMGAAAGLAIVRTPDAIEAMYPMLMDEDNLVQLEVLMQLSNLRRKETLPALIQRLNGARGRLQGQLLVNLRLITGEDHGTSAERWKKWWSQVGETFEIPTYEEALKAEDEREVRRSESKTVSTFYGLKVVSDRICFIMDTSGSMREPAEKGGGGGNRLNAAKKQLSGVLETYPEGDLFNLIFFSSDAFGWEDELVKMTDKAREDALAYVDRQRPDGATAIYDALKLAFEDRRIDTIYLLTDGDPMGGTIDNPQRIREEVATWNEARHVRINSIAVGKESPLLKWLSEDTGGDYRVE